MQHGLYHCQFNGAFVFFDLAADRYLLLRGTAACRFKKMLDGKASPEDLAWLASRGIIGADCLNVEQDQSDHVVPTTSVLENSIVKPSRFRMIEAVTTQLLYRHLLKMRPLDQILSRLEKQRPCKSDRNLEQMRAIAAAFEHSKLYIRSQDQCLPRALAITRMLFRRGIDAQLVFGVTMPFSAHCWVQHQHELLSDHLDRVRPFKPIMRLA